MNLLVAVERSEDLGRIEEVCVIHDLLDVERQ